MTKKRKIKISPLVPKPSLPKILPKEKEEEKLIEFAKTLFK
jgi:hypothetical protein